MYSAHGWTLPCMGGLQCLPMAYSEVQWEGSRGSCGSVVCIRFTGFEKRRSFALRLPDTLCASFWEISDTASEGVETNQRLLRYASSICAKLASRDIFFEFAWDSGFLSRQMWGTFSARMHWCPLESPAKRSVPKFSRSTCGTYNTLVITIRHLSI